MNTNILIIGAGRSASSLIRYIAKEAKIHDWKVTVADHQLALAKSKVIGFSHLEAVAIDISKEGKALSHVSDADLVISLLPAFLHAKVAALCLKTGTHLITASYVSDEMRAFDEEANNKGLLFLNEMGLDPGIDHLSAMEMIDEVKAQNGEILSFKSYTGGLLAPDSKQKFETTAEESEEDPFFLTKNPWEYKFTWNPRNVVLAGQGVAVFSELGKIKHIPYHKLFSRYESLSLQSGTFEAYANRDSLQYIDVYGLEGIPTILRGTLRRQGFCEAWNAFVQLGLTDDDTKRSTKGLTARSFINSFLPYHASDSVEDKFSSYLGVNADNFDKMRWLKLFEDTPLDLGKKEASAAQILQHILENRWTLEPEEIDMIVMQHRLIYKIGETTHEKIAELEVIGEDSIHTAMAKTVGIPLAIAAKLLMLGKISLTGVQIPTQKEIYQPVLEELKTLGIDFITKDNVFTTKDNEFITKDNE